jgi:E3 ubiquitin-protein ligase HERC2
VINSVERKVPLMDRHYSLQILLELAIQRGTITAILDAVLLLLTLSEKNSSVVDNRYYSLSLFEAFPGIFFQDDVLHDRIA